MAQTTTYVCGQCGQSHKKWSGKCAGCGAWNSLSEEVGIATAPAGRGAKKVQGQQVELTSLVGNMAETQRTSTGIAELDRVLGGGTAQGATILIGGDPGVGKSTLLLQTAAGLANKGRNVIYITGEESPAQVRLRAMRLQLANAPVKIATETNVANICKTIAKEKPNLLVIDSIQTMWSPALESAPGTVSQLRLATQDLIHAAKANNTTLILVGHVTKDGQIAGPRVLEHMVDTVIYFESERGDHLRILRTVKNRFGAAHEIGVFEMQTQGLMEVPNPSSIFLEAHDNSNTGGTAIFAAIEGTRPLLVEVQALAAPSSLAIPRRAVVGWNQNRLSMVLAVLEARGGISFAGRDVFLNIAGGLNITEPAADLAVAAALISSINECALPPNSVIFGEISLSGSIRPVVQTDVRLKEAQRLGFDYALTATAKKGETQPDAITPIRDVGELIATIHND
ncbi:MAG: DNA repair protein RadA [Alphaproteobacteria bacterium]|nr:DNA repair protein RadA [Alphaproteobacteria bacterium]